MIKACRSAWAALALAAGCAETGGSQASWQDVKMQGNRIEVESKGKRLSYVALDPGKSLEMTMTGPGEIRVYTRLLMPKNTTAKVDFKIETTLDQAAPTAKTRGAVRDPDAMPVGVNAAVGDRDTSDVAYSAGKHSVRIRFVEGTPGPLLVLLRWRPAPKAP